METNPINEKTYSRSLRIEDLIGMCDNKSKNYNKTHNNDIINDQRKFSHTQKIKP